MGYLYPLTLPLHSCLGFLKMMLIPKAPTSLTITLATTPIDTDTLLYPHNSRIRTAARLPRFVIFTDVLVLVEWATCAIITGALQFPCSPLPKLEMQKQHAQVDIPEDSLVRGPRTYNMKFLTLANECTGPL